ncbi:MAG: acyl-CoA dehydrogenase C-terminal domain-containing protein, partial [Sphingomonas sp.]
AGARTGSPLARLAADCAEVTAWMRSASVDDRLAGSSDFLAMFAVAVAGWQMQRQHDVAASGLSAGEGDPAFLTAKVATTGFFLDRIVPEALGRKAGAMAGADGLYSLTAEQLAAA